VGAVHNEGLHEHEHRHADGTVHGHAHHHVRDADPSLRAHEHAHATAFEGLSAIASPLSALDARAKLLAGLALILGFVTTTPLRPAELALAAMLFLSLTLIGNLPVGKVLLRSLLVIPFAGTIALLAPLQASWGSLNAGGFAAYAILSKAWLSTLTVVLVSATTPVPELLDGLRRLKVPDVMVMLLAFIYRYAGVLGNQLHSMRVAVASRAPRLGRIAHVRLYGNLAGAMVVRAYERGERVHAAMLARGFDGTLPTARTTRFGAAEMLTIACALMTAAALALY
jgi:cobalt/nickel transport system permease protein